MQPGSQTIRFGTCLIVLCVQLQLAAQEHPAIDADHARAGWIQLFDGATLFGWTPTSDVPWRVADGELMAETGKSGFLRSNSMFGDFQLSLEFRASRETNSGVFLRSTADPSDPARDCYEINIAPPSHPFPSGSLVARQRSDVAGHTSTWRSMDVLAAGDTITVLIDGTETATYRDPRPRSAGHILLQYNSGPIRFRRIRLRPWRMQPIKVDSNLRGWKRGMAPGGTIEANADGLLRIQGGPGLVELPGRYGDFVLQVECRTGAAGVNSGLFFRCIPGQPLMGYESQIYNGSHADPSPSPQAVTGAIFNRCEARRVVARDEEWFSKTIVACGPHLAVWVNGEHVSDWTDDRPIHENPRVGRRLEPGSLMLQAHDPSTDVAFRNFRIQPLTVANSVGP